MKIALGSDHGGLTYKNAIRDYLLTQDGFEIIDTGTYNLESVNYATYGLLAAEAVQQGKADLGIVICTTGEGIMIAANKVKGIRCGLAYSDLAAQKMKEHNNCNMLAFGQATMDLADVLHRIDLFLKSEFEGGRHQLRLDTISNYEDTH